MKHLFSFSIIIALVLLCISCTREDCPEDRDLGVLQYSDSSLSFIQFDKCDIVTYENRMGDQIQLMKEETIESLGPRYCIETGNCSGFWYSISGRKSCDYYQLRRFWYSYSSDSVDLHYELKFERLETPTWYSGDTSHYVESFCAIYSPFFDSRGSIRLVTSMRNKEYRSREDSLDKNDYTFISTRRFWDTTLYDLYNDRDRMWLQKENGIVAFKFRDDIYRLVDCE